MILALEMIIIKIFSEQYIYISEETRCMYKNEIRPRPSSRRSYCDRETGSVPAQRKFGG